jgi:hypothetical protein
MKTECLKFILVGNSQKIETPLSFTDGGAHFQEKLHSIDYKA